MQLIDNGIQNVLILLINNDDRLLNGLSIILEEYSFFDGHNNTLNHNSFFANKRI